jgi:hypothetical protein
VELNDELLSAYLDNELDPEQRDNVQRSLATDAGAKQRLERMRAADTRLGKALPLPGADHFHEAMSARILRNGSAVRSASWQRIAPWAAAAAVAGMVFGYLGGTTRAQPMQLAASVSKALQTMPSGAISPDGAVKVILSFQTPGNGTCRVFETTGQSGGEGLACHGAAGWQLKAWDATTPSGEGFRTAGASSLIDSAMDELQGSAALSEAEEAEAMRRNWRQPD